MRGTTILPLIPKIQEVLEYLRDHRLTAEVARTKWLLKNQKALREQVIALYKTAEPIEHHLLEVDMQLTSARRHLQSHQAYSKISSTWLHLHPLLRSRPTCHGIRRTVIDTARESLVLHFFCIILRLDPCRTGLFLIADLTPTSSRLIGLMTRTPSHALPHGQSRSFVIFILFPLDVIMTYDPDPDSDLILPITSLLTDPLR